MNECACGCGGNPSQGVFLPGHDQRLRAQIEAQAGGLLALRDIVRKARDYQGGVITESEFGRDVRALLHHTQEDGGT